MAIGGNSLIQSLQKQDIKTLPDGGKIPYAPKPYNRRNPNVWNVLFCDRSIPVDLAAKASLLRDLPNWTRSYLLVPIKVIANVLLALIMTVKRLLAFQFSA